MISAYDLTRVGKAVCENQAAFLKEIKVNALKLEVWMKKLFSGTVLLVITVLFMGCGAKNENEMEAAASQSPVTELADDDLLLTSPPVISLSDPLSSTWEPFEVLPGNYSWNYESGKEMTGVIACGAHPLEETARLDKLELPKYKNMDTVPYMIGLDAAPDRLIVRKWDAADAGNVQAEELSIITIYEPVLLLNLEPGRIYELAAIWEEEKTDQRGFNGVAGYIFATETR